MTKEDATQHIITSYGDTFKEAFEGTNINLSSIVIDKNKLSQVKEEATKAGQVFSETMLKAMEDVMSNNTYIRDFDAEFVDRLKNTRLL